MNPFEAGTRKNVPAVLVYARNRERFLMIHRDAKGAESDYHSGKWNGLGGKSELNESSWQTAAREFQEESGIGLDTSRFQSLGVLQFPNFKEHKSEDWTVFVFTVDLRNEEADRVNTHVDEGSLHWVPEKEVLGLNLWPGDRYFIPHVLERKPFLGTIWYQGSEVVRHEVRFFAS